METEQILRDFGLIVGARLISKSIAILLRLSEMWFSSWPEPDRAFGPELVENPLKGVGAQLIFTIGVSLILLHSGTGTGSPDCVTPFCKG